MNINGSQIFLLCFSNNLFTADDKSFCYTNKKKKVSLEYTLGLLMEIRPLVAWTLGSGKGSSARCGLQG